MKDEYRAESGILGPLLHADLALVQEALLPVAKYEVLPPRTVAYATPYQSHVRWLHAHFCQLKAPLSGLL